MKVIEFLCKEAKRHHYVMLKNSGCVEGVAYIDDGDFSTLSVSTRLLCSDVISYSLKEHADFTKPIYIVQIK